MFYEFCHFIVRCFIRTLFRAQAHNKENIPKTGGFMVVSNHSSFLDPLLVGGCVRRHMHYLAKRELFRIPVFRNLIRGVNTHPIHRQGLDRTAIRECVDLMRGGEILLIFPEGTRSRDGNLQPGKAGAAMIAVQAGVPCIPAYVVGSFRAWPRQRRLPRPTKVHVYYGKPFDLPPRGPEMSSKEHYVICAEEMMRRIAALRPQ
jgi:1-acyl-sn-glycerol-3-phosphate acyltransferase